MRSALDDVQILKLARETIGQEITALGAMSEALGEVFVICAQLLIDCDGLVWVTGVGTSAAVGQRFAHILSCCGVRSIFLSPADGLHGHTAVLRPADLLVAISRGGESYEVNTMVTIARQRGTTTIALVYDLSSTLARTCDYVLPISSPVEYELMGFLATTSTVVFSAVCDALCAVVSAAKGGLPEAFWQAHPGGAVGKILTSIK